MENRTNYSVAEIASFDDQTLLNVLQYPDKTTSEIVKQCRKVAKQRNLLKEEVLNDYDLKAVRFSDERLIKINTNYQSHDVRLVKAVIGEMKRRGLQINSHLNTKNIKTSLTERKAKDRLIIAVGFLVIIHIIWAIIKILN